MKDKTWDQVNEILQAVLQIEPSKRSAFLENSDFSPKVLKEVKSLLESEEGAEDFFADFNIDNYADLFAPETGNTDLLAGQEIGNYQVIREIGYGGMGAVYLAERADGKFEQRVALKMLKRELNTKNLRRRFQHERQILATLVHPNIARLLDAGTTDDGVPFLAMEYVEGLPIDVYSNKQNLNLKQRLDLFRKVCEAVAYAHRRLVVHRDLKPSNILVGEDGMPKLLDFGIAKLLTPEFEAQSEHTITQIGAMTPAYASPEQLNRENVSTATDVYSLGVILYELLSGHRPFESAEGNFQKILAAVCETEPPPPSEIASTISSGKKQNENAATKLKYVDDLGNLISESKADNETSIVQIRQTLPNVGYANPQLLRGDLDNIVLKALKKQPERRYSTVEFFSEDIRRHLEGLPVTARPDTFSYRLEKFIKRNRIAVIAAGLILLAILGGIIATLRQSRIAQAERAKAERRFNDVRALANSFLFEFSPKIENLPGSTPARELLVKRALEYLDNLSKEVTGDLELQRELAAAYQKVGDVQGNPYNPNIGDTKGALESYEKSQNIRQQLLDRDPNNLTAQSDLADILKLIGDIQSNGGDYSKAGEAYDKSLALREKIAARNPRDFESRHNLAEILQACGLIPFYEGDNKKALEFYTRVKDIYDRLRLEQPDNQKISEQYAFIFILIGEAQGWDTDFEGASKSLQTGLDLLIPLGEKYPNDLSIRRSLMLAYSKRAENFQDLEEFDTSVEFYRKSLEITEKTLKADSQSFQAKLDVAMISKKLAQALDAAGKGKESLEKLNFALKMFREMSLADPKNTEYPYNVANTRHSIGEAYMNLKDYESAIETFLKAKEEFQIVLETNPANTYAMRMSSYNFDRLAKSYAALAEKGNRREFLQKSLENFRIALENFRKIKAAGNLGEIDSKIIGETEEAVSKIEVKLNQ